MINHLPRTEPTLRIGMILPVDKRESVSFSISDPSHYQLESNKKLISPSRKSNQITVSLTDCDVVIKKIGRTSDSEHLTLHDVPAGRGFHWEKTIDVVLSGDIRITTFEDYLLVVNEVPLEQYLACVAVSEMSGQCPPALLEAQTITARSWIMAAAEKKHADMNLHACNDDCCQRYQGIGQMTETSLEAAARSKGLFLLYDDQICDARYSKSCGGITESAEEVWPMEPTPYLTSVYDGPDTGGEIDWSHWFTDEPVAYCSPAYVGENHLHTYLGNVDKEGKYFRWKVRFSQREFCRFFSKAINETVVQVHKIDSIKRGKSGRINHLYLDYQTGEGNFKTIQIKNEYDIRKMLHPSFLYSSCFMINMDEHHIEFKGAGWGHGVGLCQIGALGMAMDGNSAEDILSHYFRNSNLKKLY